MAALQQFATLSYWLRTLVLLFVGAFLGSSLFFIAFSELSGRRAGFGEVLSNAAKLFLPLFVVNLISTLVIILGCILLIVPGVMVALAWCVAGPALVAERTGITQVFNRSAQLTRDNRWRILGLVAIFFIIAAIIQGVVSAIGGAVSGGGVAGMVTFSPTRIVLSGLVSSVTTAFTYTGLAALYAQLRELKDGVGSESLAAVFD
jgi:hypothetical protein